MTFSEVGIFTGHIRAQVQRKRAAMTAGRRRLLTEDQFTAPQGGGAGRRRGSGNTGGGVQSGHEQNITLIMIIVILVFMLCNAPARLVQVCRAQVCHTHKAMRMCVTLCSLPERHNHDHNHECYSVLSTSMKTDSALQCR